MTGRNDSDKSRPSRARTVVAFLKRAEPYVLLVAAATSLFALFVLAAGGDCCG